MYCFEGYVYDIMLFPHLKVAAEKKKTEAILDLMLPKSVSRCLVAGKDVPPEFFEGVTIYFSDIHGWSNITARSNPEQLVVLLNGLYK